ncbi:PIG-L deacetylase family protein [Pseudomonas typographi]|uniref:PIG-L family deacetylase n=1 Tax=Pseudomonas typographi TaxID=2715964 RepID=A0ABR7YVX8_9PSED|nr:PIG-L family deacetylase [Pseudomonas typographi]MBD1549863.1 PIG-L family deacetylase [Pseudomonas typographi]MBD1597291.1 PIG-L family deacetylase [Pseudomonas typographi]
MAERKQLLLKAHRRSKRLYLVAAVLVLVAVGVLVAWWAAPLLAALGWLAHEAWFADHLFYRPGDDYTYDFSHTAAKQTVTLGPKLTLSEPLAPGETLVLEVTLKATWLGRWLDPYVRIGDDPQTFERGVTGRRYLNLSGQREALQAGALSLRGRFCRLPAQGLLYVFSNPDYATRRVMVLAPHADDAELAAFGLYSRCAHACIVTVTQGEIEAQAYRGLGLNAQQAARLKGRLRTWDSLAVPLWGGVPAERCVQLGYFCLRLPAMAQAPATPFGSMESGEFDVRGARQHNPVRLAADADGQPTWNNLVADLQGLLEHFQPEVVVTPHPRFDPHADHVCTTQALTQAMALSAWKPSVALLYANHLHDNDRWPMGPAGAGITLPPAIDEPAAGHLWSPLLAAQVQLDKAMALRMQHDLQGPLPFKRRLRRWVQWALAGRRWPATGEDEFFRKAVRRHELFWVRDLPR